MGLSQKIEFERRMNNDMAAMYNAFTNSVRGNFYEEMMVLESPLEIDVYGNKVASFKLPKNYIDGYTSVYAENEEHPIAIQNSRDLTYFKADDFKRVNIEQFDDGLVVTCPYDFEYKMIRISYRFDNEEEFEIGSNN